MSNVKTKVATKYNKKYKCPYCESRLEREDLTIHIEKQHEDMIAPGYTAARIAFNTINKKESGSCIICKNETKWNEDKKRYERICDNKKCVEEYKKLVAARLLAAKGVTKEEMLKDPEFQNKMLNNRKISGTYKFADGGKVSYVGSYERKFLEFMDVFLHIQSKDIQAPGPTIEYYYEGKKHFWITDFYYIPYNLVLDIKDGGKNPNNRDMQSYRSKQIEKEKAIGELGKYNYLRLTDNQFDQLIEIMLDLKDTMIDLDTAAVTDTLQYTPIIKINEAAYNESTSIDPFISDNITTLVFDMGSVLVDGDMRQTMIEDSRIPDQYVEDLIQYYWIAENQLSETATMNKCRTLLEHIVPGEMGQYIPYLMEDSVTCYKPYQYTIPLIEKLKQEGYKLYYLSNWGKWHCEAVAENGCFNFLEYFDGGIFSYQIGYSKPDSRIYKEFFKKFNIDPSTAIFFDDRIENIEAGKELGMNGIEFTKMVSDSLLTDSIVNESIQNILQEINIFKKPNIEKIAKEVLSLIKPIVLTSQNKAKASEIGLSLHCSIENTTKDTIAILVLDGSQEKRDTDEARSILRNIASSCTNKVSDIISKIDIGDGDEGCLYFTIDKKKIKNNRKDLLESSSNESAAGNAMIGTMSGVCVVNYTAPNAFSGEQEDHIGISTKDLPFFYVFKDDKLQPTNMLEFAETIDSNAIILEYIKTPVNSFDTILKEAKNEKQLYSMLTGEQYHNIESILTNPDFVLSDNVLDNVNSMYSQTIEMKDTILMESHSLVEEPKYVMPVLESYIEGRQYNYYTDIDGFFIQNEVTLERSASYESIEKIPNVIKQKFQKLF